MNKNILNVFFCIIVFNILYIYIDIHRLFASSSWPVGGNALTHSGAGAVPHPHVLIRSRISSC